MTAPKAQNPDMDFGFYAGIPRIVRTEYKKVTPLQKWIYVCLKDLCGETGTCFRTIRVLAEEIGLSVGMTSETIRVLHDEGLIHAEKKKRHTGGKEVWHITIVDIWAKNGQTHPTKRSPDEQERSHSEHTIGKQNVHTTIVHQVNRNGRLRSPDEQERSHSETEEGSLSRITTEAGSKGTYTSPANHDDAHFGSACAAPTHALVSHPEHHFLWFDDLLAPTTVTVKMTPSFPDPMYSEYEDKRREGVLKDLLWLIEAKGIHLPVKWEHETLQEVVESGREYPTHAPDLPEWVNATQEEPSDATTDPDALPSPCSDHHPVVVDPERVGEAQSQTTTLQAVATASAHPSEHAPEWATQAAPQEWDSFAGATNYVGKRWPDGSVTPNYALEGVPEQDNHAPGDAPQGDHTNARGAQGDAAGEQEGAKAPRKTRTKRVPVHNTKAATPRRQSARLSEKAPPIEFTEEGRKVYTAWCSLFRSPPRAAEKTKACANDLYPRLVPWCQHLHRTCAQLLDDIQKWMYATDKNGFYQRGITLCDIDRDFEKWQSAITHESTPTSVPSRTKHIPTREEDPYSIAALIAEQNPGYFQ